MRVVLSAALALLTLPLLGISAAYAAPTGIDTDGNQDGIATDWQGLKVGDAHFVLIEDEISTDPADNDGFGPGNSENDYDGEGQEKGWSVGDNVASGKSDVGNVLIYDYRQNGDLMLALGWDRGSGTGTQNYWIELNQKAQTSAMPVRTVGDLRINLDINGSDSQECQQAQLWDGSKWGALLPCDQFTQFGVNTAPIDDYFGSPYLSNGKIPANQFFELVINLTDLGATSCPVSGFSTFNMRTQEGNENGDTSRLKDLVQGPVNIPSDCGTIKIVKLDAATGQPVTVPGAKFEIDPNPTAGSQDATPKTVTDNDANVTAGELADADPAVGKITVTNVKPGVSYKVTELAAPEGYFLPAPCVTDAEDADRCTKKTLATGETVTFTFSDKRKYDKPEVVKTAVATYDARYTWEIDKAVRNPGGSYGASATQNVPQGTGATFQYGVTVTEKEKIKSGWEVHGTVSVKNPNSLPMTVTLSDVLSDGTVCSFPNVTDVSGAAAGLQVSLAASKTTDFGYTCAPAAANPADGTNTAKVEWSLADYPQTQEQASSSNPGTDKAQGTADYAYKVDTETDKTVTITDNQHTFDPAWVNTWGEGASPETRTYEKTFTGTPGTCTRYDNTATITETGQNDSAQANVCVGKDLTVSKNKIASLTRNYAFNIDKRATDTTLDVDPKTGKATANYTVTVTDGAATDSRWLMQGSITVSNPNDWQDVTLTGIKDEYNNDSVSCMVDTTGGLTIPKSGSKTFDYLCTFATKPSYTGTNVAWVTWDQAAASTPTGTASGDAGVVESDWTVSEVGKTVNIVDDKTVPGASHALGSVTWQAQGTTHTFTYALELQGQPGQCVSYTNTATIVETKQLAKETVEVCAPLGVSVEKTASGTYDRTYTWLIDKQVDKTHVDIDGGDYTFNYTVTATPDSYTDSGWTMGGTITAKNPNTFKTMTVDLTDVPSVGGGAVCSVTNGDDVLIGQATLVNGQVVPASASRPYTCTFGSAPLYQGGTNTAVATWDGGSASSVPTAVPFSLAKETNKTITVKDDKTVPGASNVLGTATWGAPKSFEYSLTKTGVAGQCTTYDNTATIVETGQTDTASATLCVQKALTVTKTVDATYERTYLWSITKQADKTSFEIAEGGSATAHYTVTVDPGSYVDGGWVMTGTIDVTNPNAAGVGSITADVTDTNTVGATCTVASGEDLTIAAGETKTLSYSCTFPQAGPSSYQGTNTATATWTGSGGTRTAVGTAPITFALTKKINDVVDVTDLFDDATIAGSGEVEDLGTANWFDGVKTFEYDRTVKGIGGTCVDHDNTATIVQTEQAADETVTVCAEDALELDKTVTATYERTYHWRLDKVAKQLDDVEVTDGTTGTFDYTVEVTPQLPGEAGHDDHDFAMWGTITVTNPNDYADGSITADITDVPSVGGGAVCTVEDGEDVEIDAGDSVTLDYTCTFTSRPSYSGSNEAKASWTGPTGQARTASSDDEGVTFALVNEIDKVVSVYDDKTVPGKRVELGEATWNPNGTPTRFTYQLPLTGTAGKCTDFTNTATVPLEGSPDLSDEATVTLCVEDDAVLANIVNASYDRTYDWSIAKAAGGTRFDVGDNGTARVDYTVNAIPGASTDSGWTMSGALTISNGNAYKPLTAGASTLTDLGGGAACSLTPGQDLVVPASSSRTYTYSCAFTGQPAYTGTGTTTVTWAQGSVALTSPVTFALDQETNKVVDVVDDQTVPGQVIPLGQATWNAAGTPTPFSYSLDLAADTNECVDLTNTASIVQTGANATATVTVCGPQILPEEDTRPRPRPRPPVVVAGLPETGGPSGMVLWSGAGLVLLGGALMIARGRWSRRKLGS
ncbi:SpaA isopeptide-forming pilin-related protein [Nocardioides iriomotensis]|uniref:SpaA isopeptide-forming pilin-related protein n=1 Tax=Nocardioides iriomotensis TaxID=715784 RepID=UPI0013EAF71D|nr:prealbumin-like fold domain-containing protein [Nocardioides iriomotensis]